MSKTGLPGGRAPQLANPNAYSTQTQFLDLRRRFKALGETISTLASEVAGIIAGGSIADGSITLAKLADLVAVSVIGRPEATAGTPEAITAGSDDQVLRRNSGTLSFGTVDTGGITDAAVTMAKLANLAGLSIIGRATNSTGVPAAITGTDGQVLRVAGTALGFGAIATAGLTDASVTYAKIQNVAGLSVFGNATNSAAAGADITAGSDAQVLRRSGTALGFGTVATAGITDAAVTYAKIQNVAGLSIFGRSASSSGVGADITGAADQALRVDSAGTTVGFGTLATAALAAAAVTYAKIQNVAGLSVFGRSANTSGVGADITGTDGQVLRVSGTALGFGTIVTAGLAAAAVTYAKIQNVTGLSVFGNSGTSAATGADITGTTDQVLRVSTAGTTLGFGTVATGGITAAAVTYAKIQNVAGLSVVGRSTNSSGVAADITGTDGQALRVSGTALGFGNVLTNFVQATATNDSATAGNIGEYAESIITDGSVGSWSNNSPKNIGSITLGAGDWLVQFQGDFEGGAITGTGTLFGLSLNTGSFTGATCFFETPSVPTTNAHIRGSGMQRFSLSGSTTIFFVGRILFSGGTPTAGGVIRAWRQR
jgi:hypothetical protein